MDGLKQDLLINKIMTIHDPYYKAITGLKYETCCFEITALQWDSKMEGAIKGNKKIINYLVKIHCPDMYASLALNFYNPYDYYRTDRYLILVHSSIEYFFKIKRN